MTRPPSPTTHATQAPRPLAILLAAQLPDESDHDVTVSLRELEQLLVGLGIETLERVRQKRPEANSVRVLGAGKLEEIKQLIDSLEETNGVRSIVVFDGDLSPGQKRALELAFETEVLDRTQVILKVFSDRARTTTARLEVELARLKYEAPRARDDSALEDQAGGGGRGGQGHTAVELRKQGLRQRMAFLREEIEREAGQSRSRRERRQTVPRVALVGYTNAGKSSLLRALTGAEALVEDKLFATLGTTVRALEPPTVPRILVADTVGFIRNLPNHLLASFRSTLEEALDASLLLLVLDSSDTEWPVQLEVTESVLEEVGAGELPTQLVFNKVDRLSPQERAELEARFPKAWLVSATLPQDVAGLHAKILDHFHRELARANVLVPYAQGKLVGEIHSQAHVISEKHLEAGTELEILAESRLIAGWLERLSG